MNDKALEQTDDELGQSLTYSIRKSDMFTNLVNLSAYATANEPEEQPSGVQESSNEKQQNDKSTILKISAGEKNSLHSQSLKLGTSEDFAHLDQLGNLEYEIKKRSTVKETTKSSMIIDSNTKR